MISVVTITLNNLDGLRKTAASVEAQTCADFEWIVIDGGSADGTVEFVRSLSRPPTYFISEKDGGIYDAMNKGVARATGKYVICLNAGDAFHDADVLASVVKCGLTADVVYGDWYRVYRYHRRFYPAPRELPPFYFFMPKGTLCHQAMFVRTQLLKDSPFDSAYFVLADLAKWRQFMLEDRSFRYIPQAICDFDATEGVSTKLSEKNIRDEELLRNAFPIGLHRQGVALDKLLERRSGRLPWFVRKLRGGLKCLEEHGLSYTLRVVRGKLKKLQIQ